MRILLTGASGQIGRELVPFLSSHEVIAPSHAECDLADPESIRAAVRAARPDAIVNPAAYTAVDKAEAETDVAQAVNVSRPASSPKRRGGCRSR